MMTKNEWLSTVIKIFKLSITRDAELLIFTNASLEPLRTP